MIENYQKVQDYIVKIRRELHQIPELDTNLPQTSAVIKRELDAMGIPYKQNTKDSGIIALIQGKNAGKCIAIRADMDALPIKEETGLPFASQNGCMHACGHDSHAAMLLGTAKVLNQCKDKINGSVKLIFQTAEETARGAEIMIEEGALENPKVDALIGLHIGSIYAKEVSLGNAAIVPGTIMASYDKFIIKVKGHGCHGSTPEKGVDPIAISATIISALQNIVSREISATLPAVITIGQIHGGFAYNIIPDDVTMEGTIRATSQEVRQMLSDRICEVSKAIASSAKAEAEYEIIWGAPPVVNDINIVKTVQKAAERIVGEENVVSSFTAPNMGGEDVAHYLQQVPGAFFFLGSNNPAKHTDIPHHNCKFDIDEDVMWKGSAIFTESVFEFLNQ